MQKFKKIITKFIVILSLGCLLTAGIFFCANRPITTKAVPITGAVVITGAILAFLAACGVELTASDMDTTTLQECVEDMTSDYTYDNKTGATSWYSEAGEVANVISGGNSGDKIVILGSAFSQWLKGLPDHLETKYGINSSTSSDIINDGTGYIDDNGNFLPVVSTSSGGKLNCSVNDGFFELPLSSGQSVSYVFGGNSFGLSLTTDGNIAYAYSYINGNLESTISSNTYYGRLNNQNVFLTDISGGTVYWALDRYGLYIGNVIINISSLLNNLSVTSIGMSGVLTDGYQDFQDAMDEAIGRIENNVTGVIGINVGVLDGVVTQEQVWDAIYAQSLDNTLSGELTGDYTDEEEAKEELKASEMPNTGELTGNIVVIDGLEDFFPFCIPFDLYEILSVLSVPPETPDFTYTISFGGLFDDFDVDIDLSDFDGVARLFRIMMLIGFVVFLILKTRDLIRG